LNEINDSDCEIGQIWNFLAIFFISVGKFGLARDIFEEALDQIIENA
jgi:hypothetical protein